MSKEELEENFINSHFVLDEDTILKIDKTTTSCDVHNVITGFKRQCYGLTIDREEDTFFNLFYINGDTLLQGDLLKVDILNSNRDDLSFYFTYYLTNKYNNLDLIDTFNRFQDQIRSMFEKLGYLTISIDDFERSEDKNLLFMAKNIKGIIPVKMIDKAKFYKNIFGNKIIDKHQEKVNFIYLMLNCRDNTFKIGRSKTLAFRERTLLSQEPKIELISFWEAPIHVEKDLHNKFSDKRVRGEWFKLTFNDLRLIRDYFSKIMQDSSN